MSAATAAAATSSDDKPRRLQKSLRLSPPWLHHQESQVTAWGVYAGDEPTLAGRCGLTLRCGAATFDIDPTPDQMRAIAALLIEAADTAGAA